MVLGKKKYGGIQGVETTYEVGEYVLREREQSKSLLLEVEVIEFLRFEISVLEPFQVITRSCVAIELIGKV